MQVVFHLGAYSTDADRLIGTLNANPDVLSQHGILIPPAANYRTPLRDTLMTLRGGVATQETSYALIDVLTDEHPEGVNRLILSHGNFLALPEKIITPGGLYPIAGDRVAALANLFPEHEVEFHFSLINPALLISALVARQARRTYADITAGQPPEALSWVPTIARMAEAARGQKVVVWCNEDMPLILPEVVRALGGIDAAVPLADEDALVSRLLTDDGLKRLRDYLRERPPQSTLQRRKVVSAFLESHPRRDALEVTLDLPGWTDDLAEEITESYDEDMGRIAALPGVTLISP